MRYLGLDLGTRTLGIAISDKTGIIASTLKTIRFQEGKEDTLLEEIKKAELVPILLELYQNTIRL